MPFGLPNAPSTFHAMMDQVLEELVRTRGVIVFIGNIIMVTLGDESEHMVRVMAVLEQLHKVMKNKIDQAMDWPELVDITHIRQFLGLCGCYRRFVKNFAPIAAPLSSLL